MAEILPCASAPYLSADESDEALDLEELMKHWSDKESIVFSGKGPAHDPPVSEASADLCRLGGGPLGYSTRSRSCSCGSSCSSCSGRRAPVDEERARAVQLLRLLASSHDADAELPAALTLLDALRQRESEQEPGCALEGFLASPVLLVALLRLALKNSRAAAVEEANVSDRALCDELGYQWQEAAEPGPITQAEVAILAALQFRVSLPSPVEWVGAILTRLTFLKTSPQLREVIGHVLPSAASWSCVLAERVGASSHLPPRALALGALALGLIGNGLLPPEQMRPEGLLEPSWKESLLYRMEARDGGSAGAAWARAAVAAKSPRGGGEEGRRPPALDARHLAKAACCSEIELQHCVFDVVTAYQRSLYGDGAFPASPPAAA